VEASTASTTEVTTQKRFDVGLSFLSGEAQTALQELAEAMDEARGSESAADRADPTRVEVAELFEPDALPRQDYIDRALTADLRNIARALSDWPGDQAHAIIKALRSRWIEMDDADLFDLNLAQVERWLRVHRTPDETDPRGAVIACIESKPPVGVEIHRRLPKTGMQKVVYQASWSIGERKVRVALKQILKGAQYILPRELQAHPLHLLHPNIVQTYMLPNNERPRENFLIERWLGRVLSDASVAPGIHEAARLLVDLARALTFLHDLTLVHADLKADNIGIDGERYILLDFGICRPRAEFALRTRPSGSLRTRAPELLLGGRRHNTEESDIWALGATVFKFIAGRYPLFTHDDEELPQAAGSKGAKVRSEFEKSLRRRAENEWDAFLAPVIDIDKAETNEVRTLREHDRFRRLLAAILAADPARRPNALTVLHRALVDLPSLVGESPGRVFAPGEELRELDRHLGDQAELRLLPLRKREEFSDRARQLHASLQAQRYAAALVKEMRARYEPLPANGLSEEDRKRIQDVLEQLRRFTGTVADKEDDALVGSLLQRLENKARDEEDAYKDLLGDLQDRLSEAVSAPSLKKYDEGGFVRRAASLRQALQTH
jgi:serine/threonine protein kinase